MIARWVALTAVALLAASVALDPSVAQEPDLTNMSDVLPGQTVPTAPPDVTVKPPVVPIPEPSELFVPDPTPLEKALGVVRSAGALVGETHAAATDAMLGLYRGVPEDVRPFVFAGFGVFGGVSATLCDGPEENADACGEDKP